MQTQNTNNKFTRYQIFVIVIVAVLQFTIVLDFMVMSPLGDMLMKTLEIKPSQFGMIVASYALSAMVSGLMAAGFADKFDRKRILLFFYVGFVGGTLLCGLANTYEMLLIARVVTGLFGGVIGALSMAIITDLFPIEQRGRVMGFVQMAFAASQVLGIPISLFIANRWGWNSPFLMIVGFAILVFVVIAIKLKPVNEHLKIKSERNVWQHLIHTISLKNYRAGFLATALLSLGGFMLMPFASAFSINNLGVTPGQLPYVFMFTGISSIIIMPLIGKLSDKVDKFKIFTIGTIWAIVMVLVYTNMSAIPLWEVIILNVLLFMGIMSRMVPVTALTSAVPEMKDRGAYMSINSSLQQGAGGIAAMLAGSIVVQETKNSPLQHFNWLGIVMAVIMVLCIYFVYRVDRIVKERIKVGGK